MATSRVQILIRNVRMELGEDRGHGVEVELSNGQIVHAIRASFTLYNRYFPKKSIQSFVVPMGEFEYEPDPHIRGILDISIQQDHAHIIDGGALTPGVLSSFGYGPGVINYGSGAIDQNGPRSYANFLEWKRGISDLFSSTPGYFFDETQNKLFIYSPNQNSRVTLTGSLDYDVAWDEEEMWEQDETVEDGLPSEIKYDRLEMALKEVSNVHMRWVRSGTMAKSKQILGRMLRKYGQIPTIDGESVQLDGDSLIDEGKEEWQSLQEEIRSAEPEPPPIFG